MTLISHRKNSKVDWCGNVDGDSNPNREDIQLGAILRIADATEVMAQEYTRLIHQRDMYERWARERLAQVDHLTRQNSALRGVITRQKNAAKRKGQGADNAE